MFQGRLEAHSWLVRMAPRRKVHALVRRAEAELDALRLSGAPWDRYSAESRVYEALAADTQLRDEVGFVWWILLAEIVIKLLIAWWFAE